MREPLVRGRDGCPEFDARLLESAFASTADAELDRHLSSCGACRAARDEYLATADALAGALASPPDSVSVDAAAGHRFRPRNRCLAPYASPPHPDDRPSPRRMLAIVSVAAAVLAAVGSLWILARPSALEVTPSEHASLVVSGSERASLRRGSARFDLRRGTLVVETPYGNVRCQDAADFTVLLADGPEDPMNAKRTSVAVATITVAAGVVWWVEGGREIALPEGRAVIERAGAEPRIEPAPIALAQAPAVSAGDVAPEARVAAATPPEEVAAVAPAPESFEILGRVVDATTGVPVAGATVALAGRRSAFYAFEARAESGDDGSFRAPSSSMDPQRVASTVFHEGPLEPRSFLEVRASGYATLLEVPWGGQFERLNPLDRSQPIDLGELRLARGSTIAGRVVRERDGSPVADAAILLVEDTGTWNLFVPSRALELARSRDDGTFELSQRIAPMRGYGQRVLFALSAEGLAWTLLDVVEGRERIDELLLALGSPARIEVEVRDPEGKPIEGAKVTAEPRFSPLVIPLSDPSHGLEFGPREDLRALFCTSTDAHGRAVLASLPSIEQDAAYDVMAEIAGRAVAWRDGVIAAPGSRTELTLVLEEHRPREIAGTVRDEDGAPIEGASVTIGCAAGVLETASGASGRFSAMELEPGDSLSYRIAAPGLVVFVRSVYVPHTQPVEALEVVLGRPLPIAGRVVDQFGEPVAGAQVRLNQGDQWRMLATPDNRTPADGHFEFADTFAGEWRMVVIGPKPESDWVRGITEHFLQGGDTDAEIVFERALERGASLVAEIVDAASGAALESREAMLIQELAPGDERNPWVQVTRGVGRATAENVRPGKWRLWVRADGHALGHADFEIAPGQREVHLRLDLGAPGTLAGRVRFDERIPFRPLVVRARLGEHTTWVPGGDDGFGAGSSVSRADLQVGSDGSFALENATPGRWSLELRAGGILASATVEVPRGAIGRAEIEPRLGGTLAFRAVGVEPVALMEVSVLDGADPRWRASGKLALGDADTFARQETVEPGRVLWRVDFKHGGVWSSLRDAAEPQRGEVIVGPGERIEIDVPCVLLAAGD